MYNTEMIPLVVLACCILHNICIDIDDEPFEIPQIENINNNNHNYAVMKPDEKREIIAQLLF